MTRRLLIGLCLLALAAPAGAAPRAKQAAATRATAAAPVRTAAGAPKRDAATATARTGAAPRRLEDIHIEGEIPAPQVLFITARDQRRFTKFHHRRYLKTSVQVGETTPLPTRVALTRHPPTPAEAP